MYTTLLFEVESQVCREWDWIWKKGISYSQLSLSSSQHSANPCSAWQSTWANLFDSRGIWPYKRDFWRWTASTFICWKHSAVSISLMTSGMISWTGCLVSFSIPLLFRQINAYLKCFIRDLIWHLVSILLKANFTGLLYSNATYFISSKNILRSSPASFSGL